MRSDDELVACRLHDLAHGRTGDKGNRINVSVIAYDPGAWPFLAEQVTAERVLALFAHRGATRAIRYELPRLAALNFVIDDVLQGGVNHSLGLDGHGKTLAFRVLSMPLRAPRGLLEAARAGIEAERRRYGMASPA